MFKVFQEKEFDAYLKDYVTKIFDPSKTYIPAVSVSIRDKNKKEFTSQDFSSHSNPVAEGDIVFGLEFSIEKRDTKLNICLGTLLEQDNLIESFARKYFYDRIFDREGVHKSDTRYSCVKPQHFGHENTPCITIPFSHNGKLVSEEFLYKRIKEKYELSKKYLKIIDSLEFEEFKEQIRKGAYNSLESTLLAK